MRKLGIIAVLSLLVTAFAAVPALAATDFSNAPQGAHYAQGFGEPVCTLTGTTVTCTGTEIAGVGNTNATVTLAVTSTFTGTCTNPGGHMSSRSRNPRPRPLRQWLPRRRTEGWSFLRKRPRVLAQRSSWPPSSARTRTGRQRSPAVSLASSTRLRSRASRSQQSRSQASKPAIRG